MNRIQKSAVPRRAMPIDDWAHSVSMSRKFAFNEIKAGKTG